MEQNEASLHLGFLLCSLNSSLEVKELDMVSGHLGRKPALL